MSTTKEYESERKLRHTSDGQVEVSIPSEVVEDYSLAHQQPYRITPELDGTQVTFRVDVGPDVSGKRSNERTFKQYQQTKMRWPSHIAQALEMHSFADDSHVATIFEQIDDQSFRVSTWPALEPTTNGSTDLIEGLSQVRKSLVKIKHEDSPTGVKEYRLELPNDYRDMYELEEGDEFGVRISARDGQLALVIELEPSEQERRTWSWQTWRNGVEDFENLQFGAYISKQLVHGLDEAVGTNVKLRPEHGRIVLL